MADYLEGDLGLRKRALFDAHIDWCESCRRELNELRGTISLLRTLPDEDPPPFFTEHVMRRIRDGEGRTTLLDRARDAVAALAAPRLAVPAAALALGLAMWANDVDPTRIALPDLERVAVERDPRVPSVTIRTPAGRVSLPDAVDPSLPPGATAEATRVASSPLPRAERLPRGVTRGPVLRIPLRVPTDPGRLVSWPSLSLPGEGLVIGGGSAPLAPAPSPGVMQARVQDTTASNALVYRDLGPEAVAPGGAKAKRTAELASQLDRLVSNPTVYAVEFANLSIAAQELWLDSLAEYAAEVGRSDEVLRRLRGTGHRSAQELATAFATQLRLVENARHEVAAVVPSETKDR